MTSVVNFEMHMLISSMRIYPSIDYKMSINPIIKGGGGGGSLFAAS